MPHAPQKSLATVLIVGVAAASVVVGAVIVVVSSPESIRFAGLSNATFAFAATVPSSQTPGPSHTNAASNTPTFTRTPTASTTGTVMPSRTPSPTRTASPTPTQTASRTVGPTNTATVTSTPSPTLTPSETPLPPEVDRAEFVADITVPDGTEIKVGASFTKTWRIRNVGTTTWTTDYKFEFAGGAEMPLVQTISLPAAVGPGDTIDISVEMVAPSNPGKKVSLFQLRSASGQPFGVGPSYNDFIYVQIIAVE